MNYFSTININRKILNAILIILLIFILSRYILYFHLDIKPANTLSIYWQLFHLDLLEKDLFRTLIYSHSQPFLWNLIVGIFLKLNAGNESNTVTSLLFLNYFFSILILIYAWNILDNFRFTYINKLICVSLLCLYPGVFFYENLIFYSQLTCFLIFQLFYLFIRYIKSYNIIFETLIYINLLIMGFIWTAFHPLVIIIAFFFINFLKRKIPNKKSFYIFLTILLISTIPFLKNKILFGISSSGWTGFYLCQTIVFKANIPECAHNVSSATHDHQEEYFIKYKKNKEDLNHPNLNKGPMSKRHHLGFIIVSDNLLKKTKEFIIKNPEKYIAQRMQAILASHGKFSFDYGIKPQNWREVFSFFQKIEINQNLKLIRQIIVFIIMGVIYLNLILFLFKKKSLIEKKSIIFLMLIYLYFYFLSIATNGHEHERIMYTFIIVNFLSISLMIKKCLKILKIE